MNVIHLPELDAMGDRFCTFEIQKPLRITLRTLQPIAGSDRLHLDGILAKAVVLEALQGKSLPQTADAYWIPLPLGLERLHEELPLWASTDFLPADPAIDRTHFHQRTDANSYDLPATFATLDRKKPRRMPPTSEGQYMSYRVPIQRTSADCWQATCVGSKNEILRLLELVQFVGKKSAHGYGRVLSWEVGEIDSFELRDRPIPLESPEEIIAFGGAQMQGWTPPYWHRGLWRLCRIP